MNEAIIETCEFGHKFAKLPDHPTKDGVARCPHCMAEGLDRIRKRDADILDAANDAVKAIQRSYGYTAILNDDGSIHRFERFGH